MGAQEFTQPGNGIGVQMIGWLVEQQRLGPAEQNAGEFDTSPLPTGQGSQRLIENALRKPETGRDRGRFGFGRVPAPGEEFLVEARVARHRLVARFVVGAGHRPLVVTHSTDDLVELAGRQDAILRAHVEVAGARVLRQVSHPPGAGDRAVGRLALSGEDSGQRRLAGTIATHEADPIARHAKRRVLEQQAWPCTQLEIGGGDHGSPSMAALARDREAGKAF